MIHTLKTHRTATTAASLLAAGAFVCALANPAQALIQASTPLVASDASASARLGTSVAASEDGSTVFAGSTQRTISGASAVGAVYAYLNVPAGEGLTQTETAILTPAANDYETASTRFGASIASSSDGRTVAIGAPGYGEVYIFTRTGASTTWTEATKIYEPASGSFPDFGTTVALSGDGTRLLVGAPGNSGTTSTGAVHYYNSSGGSWTLESTVAGSASGAHFGASLALSNDGLKAAVGSPKTTTPKVSVYSVGPTSLTSSTTLSAPTGVSTSSGFGAYGLSVDDTGALVAVGAPSITSLTGLTGTFGGVLFVYSTASPATPTELYKSGVAAAQLGTSVALSPNGLDVIAGAPGATGGTTYAWTRTSTSSAFTGSPTPLPTLTTTGGEAGYAVDFGSNSRLIVGNPYETYTGLPTSSGEAEIVDIS